jgi:chromosomal replication initiator protein
MTIKEHEDVRLLKSTKEVWTQVLELLKKNLSAPTFESWIRPTILVEMGNGEASIGVANEFMRTMVSNHLDSIATALEQVTNERFTVKVITDPSAKPADYAPNISSITVIPEATEAPQSVYPGARPGFGQPSAPAPYPQRSVSSLNPKYTFETFVVGSHNRFSHSAAFAVAKSPGQTYNPLFLYGGVGLGKTHIMQAIGHEILRHTPSAKVQYLSCEKFTNELINSIRDDRMLDFRKRYRQIDVLLVDDIQFIQGKESTQEEFFHTFNALRDNGRQIVLSSDRPPKAISLLEERLRSRFEWGLIADIQAPDLETRMAILRKKSEIDNMIVQDEVLEYIASLFTTNIRELEGALIRANAYASLTGEPLTMSVLKGVLQHIGPAQAKPVLTMEKIIDTVASYYRVESSEIRSSKRSADLTLPRHIAMYLAHDLLQMSFPRIGQAFGNRKHTSALYAHDKIKEAIPKDANLSESVKQIRRQLQD